MEQKGLKSVLVLWYMLFSQKTQRYHLKSYFRSYYVEIFCCSQAIYVTAWITQHTLPNMFCLLTRIASITLFFKIFEIIGGSCTRVGLPVLPRFLHYNLEVMGSSCGNNLFACNGKVSYVGSLVHLAAVLQGFIQKVNT